MNLASALTGGFATDIGINQSTINLGNQMLFLGIMVLEIPSNMILQRLGPRKYMSGQVLVFGFIATMQIFVKNRYVFLVSRAFLGLAEAGYIPGALYTLSTWYRRRELAKRVAIFSFGMFGGNALSPLLASGILKLDGRQGISGWQWIFLLEGVFTMTVAILLLLLLPGSPEYTKPLFWKGFIRISSNEGILLQKRIAADYPEHEYKAQHIIITPKKVWKTVSHWRRWPHFLATSLVFSTWSPLTTYTPTIIMSLGFDRTSANALASVGSFIALAVVFAFAFISDRTNKRGLTVAIAITCYLITLIVGRTIGSNVGKWSKWGLWTSINAFAIGYHPVHNTWLQLNCTDPAERSISIAMWVMSAITGLMYGTQYFQAGDKPLYHRGLSIMIGVVLGGLVLVSLQELIYYFHNKHFVKQDPEGDENQKQLYIL
ncbi:major facilitator superfamily domain-containing protein [Bisporella sp. PMI_857]|nr:major facilitator superfamily domain-containing protein [Bisporella sp. PMI_857]